MIKVQVQGTKNSRVLDDGEYYEMSLGSLKEYQENHKVSTRKAVEQRIKDRASVMGDKVISIDIQE